MAKNKHGSYFGKDDFDFIDNPDLTPNSNSQDLIDNNLDYQDYLNELDDNYYQSQPNQDYDDNYIDDNYQDDYSNHDYPEYYDDDSQPISADSISEAEAEEINALLKNISEKLERLEKAKKKEVAASAPFYAPNAIPPYVVIPSQNAGNEVILNELAKLREENYRMQHSQEIQRQLNALKEELNAKLAALSKTSKETPKQDQKPNGQAALLEELQKLNKKIEQLEAKSKSEDFNQLLELINRLEAKINTRSQEQPVKLDNEESVIDIINQIRSVSLKSDDVLAYIKSIRHALGLSAVSHINENGEIDYSDLKEEYAEFKKTIATGNLYAKISAIFKFNELIAELPVGVHEEIAADFFKIRNRVFGTVLTPEVAAELIYNSTAADKERDIYYYFELKAELDRADAYELPQVAEKFLKLRNRLQNNQYVTYNQNLFNELIEANNDYQYDKSDYAKDRLEKAKEIFSTLRIGDIVPINDYSKIRPAFNYKSISDRLNELYKLIKEKDFSDLGGFKFQLDSIINEIKAAFGKQKDANAEDINKIIDEITALKESLIEASEQRHLKVLQELGDIRQEFAQSNIPSDLEYIKAQVANLQEELQSKNINYELILNAVNEIKEQFSALTDYSDYADYETTPAVTNENILDEIRALKEQIYIQKGEIDPEILNEVRNLKELLTNARKEESYKEILEALNKLQNTIDQNALTESQDYQTVLTSALEVLSAQVEQLTQKADKLASQDNDQLLTAIEEIKADIKAINIPTILTEDNKVKVNYAELQQQLDSINESINRLADLSANGNRDMAINVFRESMVEVLNEITNLKDEYIYQSEKNEQLSNEIYDIKEQLTQYFESAYQKSELNLLQEINELKELVASKAMSTDGQSYQEVLNEINELKELVASKAASTDGQSNQEVLNELNAIKEQLALNSQVQESILQLSKSDENAQILKTINELKENFLVGKADTDNTFIIETASIREQLNALKQTLDFEKISQDINDLKSAISDNKPEIDIEAIRQIIKEEINAPKAVELAVSVAAIEKQVNELKKEFSKRQESDAQILNLMSRVAELLENKAGQDFSAIASDLDNLKKEINALKAQKEDSVSEESQRFASKLTDLKEDLSKIAQFAELDDDNMDALREAVATEEPIVEEPAEEEPIELEPEITDESLSQKELLKKSLLESGLSEESVMEIINSIYPDED
ncbi:MAG TPA: hypothetical protein VIL24_06440 [Clostridia bacterium]